MPYPLLALIILLLDIVQFLVFASVIMHFLVVFKVVNLHQPLVYKIHDLLFRLTEPVFDRVRRVIPPFNGVDLAPLVVLILIYFIRVCIAHYFGYAG